MSWRRKEGISNPEQLKQVELSSDAMQAAAEFRDTLAGAIIDTTSQHEVKGRDGKPTTKFSVDLGRASEEYAERMQLEYPDAVRDVRRLMSESVKVYKRRNDGKHELVSMRLGEALVDELVYIPESHDGSDALTVQALAAKFGVKVIPGALRHAEQLKQGEVDAALPDSPLKKLSRRVFGSRGGSVAVVGMEALSAVSAIPNYFAIGEVFGHLMPDMPGELLFGLSVYGAGAIARAANIYGRDVFRRAMHGGQGYWRATASMMRDKSKDGRKLVELKLAKPVISAIERAIKHGVDMYDNAKANVTGKEKPQRDLSWTLNPEITIQQYMLKAGAFVAISFGSTFWGYVNLQATQEGFEESVTVASGQVADQREAEVRKFADTLINPDPDKTKPTVANIADAMIKTENDGKPRQVGNNKIVNQSAGPNRYPNSGKGGVAYQAKVEAAPKLEEEVRKDIDIIVGAQRRRILESFEVLKKAGLILPESKVEELAEKYVGMATAELAKRSVADMKRAANHRLQEFGALSKDKEVESRGAYLPPSARAKLKEVVDYKFDLPDIQLEPLSIDLKVERPEFWKALQDRKEKEGNLKLLEFIALGLLITFLIEQGYNLLLPNIAGKTKHNLRNLIRRTKLPYTVETLPGSMDQQVDTSAVGALAGLGAGGSVAYGLSAPVTGGVGGVVAATIASGYAGAKEEGKLTSVQDRVGDIQAILDGQMETLIEVYLKALQSINFEFSQILPGIIPFTPESVRAGVANYIDSQIHNPPLFDRVIEPLMAPGAIRRRRQQRGQERLLKPQGVTGEGTMANIIAKLNSSEFEKLISTMMPIKAYRLICKKAANGKIHDLALAVRLANLVWEKTGNDDRSAAEAIIDVCRDWRTIKTKISAFEAMPEPELRTGRVLLVPDLPSPRLTPNMRPNSGVRGSSSAATDRAYMGGNQAVNVPVRMRGQTEGDAGATTGLEQDAVGLEDTEASMSAPVTAASMDASASSGSRHSASEAASTSGKPNPPPPGDPKKAPVAESGGQAVVEDDGVEEELAEFLGNERLAKLRGFDDEEIYGLVEKFREVRKFTAEDPSKTNVALTLFKQWVDAVTADRRNNPGYDGQVESTEATLDGLLSGEINPTVQNDGPSFSNSMAEDASSRIPAFKRTMAPSAPATEQSEDEDSGPNIVYNPEYGGKKGLTIQEMRANTAEALQIAEVIRKSNGKLGTAKDANKMAAVAGAINWYLDRLEQGRSLSEDETARLNESMNDMYDLHDKYEAAKKMSESVESSSGEIAADERRELTDTINQLQGQVAAELNRLGEVQLSEDSREAAQAKNLYRDLSQVLARLQRLTSWNADGVSLEQAVQHHELIAKNATALIRQVGNFIDMIQASDKEPVKVVSRAEVSSAPLEVAERVQDQPGIVNDLKIAQSQLGELVRRGAISQDEAAEVAEIQTAIRNLLGLEARTINEQGARMQINRANGLLTRLGK